jgi:hypothetical protein
MTPNVFQSGFVANRIAREQHRAFPNAEIEVVPCKGKGHAKELSDGSFIWVGEHAGFMIRKTEGGEVTFYIGIEDGFQAVEEADGAAG